MICKIVYIQPLPRSGQRILCTCLFHNRKAHAVSGLRTRRVSDLQACIDTLLRLLHISSTVDCLLPSVLFLCASTSYKIRRSCLVELYVSLLLPSEYVESHTDLVHDTAPPSVIATWPHPNYVDPVTEGPALMVVGIVLGSITMLLVAARIYSRLFITRAPGIDDLLIVISLVRQQPIFDWGACQRHIRLFRLL